MVFGFGHLVLTLLYYYTQKDKGHSLDSWSWEGAEIDDYSPLSNNIDMDATSIRTNDIDTSRLSTSIPDSNAGDK